MYFWAGWLAPIFHVRNTRGLKLVRVFTDLWGPMLRLSKAQENENDNQYCFFSLGLAAISSGCTSPPQGGGGDPPVILAHRRWGPMYRHSLLHVYNTLGSWADFFMKFYCY